ncbi:MAG: ATP-dependent helicase DeaD [Patescibacteria group bacterium]|jgi:superfamily II DNA/RNA helicase|nr:ATP-dependent helicase DeaD [Patescibacteria group bacterium]
MDNKKSNNRSFSKSKRFSKDKPKGGFKKFGGGGRRGASSNKRRGPRKSTADVSRFVKKATPSVEEKALPIKHLFSDFNFSEDLQKNLESKKFVTPTHIQDESIPFIIDGRDIVGLANTGTGKTGAFLLPLIDKVFKDKKQKVLILAPTRELAMQIDKEFRAFSYGMRIYSAMCVGGMPIWKQINDLARNPNFIIGTPGRIKDLSERGKINYGAINNIVLDEVDHMLDMGFVEPITEILNNLKKERQSLFFSATMPENIKKLISKFTENPVIVEVASKNNINNIDQDIIKVTESENKFPRLVELLKEPGFDKVIIFIETKRGADKLSSDLFKEGFLVDSIHGDKRQGQRKRAIDSFDRNKIKVLVATDVAARGLDIDGITHVINYTVPGTNEDYTHRIGRTGRGGKKGVALTFV